MQETAPKKQLPRSWRIAIIAMIAMWALLAVGVAAYFIHGHVTKQRNPADQAKYITAKVGKHYMLPSGEKPTVAQIKDMSKLADQPFYGQAQNGDYLILYSETKLAIIYRESNDILVNVAPIAIPNRN